MGRMIESVLDTFEAKLIRSSASVEVRLMYLGQKEARPIKRLSRRIRLNAR